MSSRSPQLTQVTAPPTPPQRQPQRGLDPPTLTSDLGVAVSGCLGFQGDREGLSGEPVPRPHVGRAWCSKEAAQPQSTASQSPPARPGAERLSPGQTAPAASTPSMGAMPECFLGPSQSPQASITVAIRDETEAGGPQRLAGTHSCPGAESSLGPALPSASLCGQMGQVAWLPRRGIPVPMGRALRLLFPVGRALCRSAGTMAAEESQAGTQEGPGGLQRRHGSDTECRGPGGDTRACCHTCARRSADESALGSGTDVAGPRQLPCPPPSCLPASVVLQARWGLPRGSSPPPNEMICSIIKSKPRNSNSYSHGDQKESQAETLQ